MNLFGTSSARASVTISVAAGLALTSCSVQPPQVEGDPDPSDPAADPADPEPDGPLVKAPAKSPLEGRKFYDGPPSAALGAPGNQARCSTCHSDDGTQLHYAGNTLQNIAFHEGFKGGMADSLLEATNMCVTAWMHGEPLDDDDERWEALEGFLQAISDESETTTNPLEPEILPGNAWELAYEGGHAQMGALAFNRACATCHARALVVGAAAAPSLEQLRTLDGATIARKVRTSGPPPSQTDDEEDLTPGPMPFFEEPDLPGADLRDIVAYLTAAEIVDPPDPEMIDGRALYNGPESAALGAPTNEARCSTCHSDDGSNLGWAGNSMKNIAFLSSYKNGMAPSLLDAVNMCVTGWMGGEPLVADGELFSAMNSYFASISEEAVTTPNVMAPQVLASTDWESAYGQGGDEDLGQARFESTCAKCHVGSLVVGSMPAPPVEVLKSLDRGRIARHVRTSGPPPSQSDPVEEGMIADDDTPGPMPFFELQDLPEADLNDILTWLVGSPILPEDGRKYYDGPESAALGAPANQARCSTCHSDDGTDANFSGASFANIAFLSSYKGGQVSALIDAANMCVTGWMGGEALTSDDARWTALHGYLVSISDPGVTEPNALAPEVLESLDAYSIFYAADLGDAAAGAAAFEAACVRCHGEELIVGTVGAPSVAVLEASDAGRIARHVRTSGPPPSAVGAELDLTPGPMPFFEPSDLSVVDLQNITAFLVGEVVGPVEGWTCQAEFFGDGECDCGCGVLDADCADNTMASCQFTGCGGPPVDPSDPTQCVTEWSCTAGWFGDGECDCGCGAVDLDCGMGSAIGDCQYGVACGGLEQVDPADPTQCLVAP